MPKFRFREKYIKWLLSLAALSYLIFHFTQLSYFDLKIFDNIPLSLANLFFASGVLFLTFINWSLEALKWKFALKPIFKLSFSQALEGILYGLTVAIFTPNRSGEFVGRIFVIPKRYRLHAIGSTIFANMFQLSMTILFGTISLLVWSRHFSGPLTFTIRTVPSYSIFIGIAATVILLLIYFFRKRLFELNHVVSQLWRYFKRLSFKTIIWLVGLSLVRYLVFIFQFWMIINILTVDITFQNTFLGLSLTYYALALLPIITFAEPITRGSLSLIFFGNFTQQSTEILIAILALWIVNLAIPSIVGSVIMSYSKKEND